MTMAWSKLRTERFWSRVRTGARDDCWLWEGSMRRDGYGQFSVGGRSNRRQMMPHRIAYEMIIGPIPVGKILDHLCRVRHCVNPRHLEPVTNRENVLRGDGVTARNARKTHCPQGHPLAGHNLVPTFLRMGARKCRRCHAETDTRARERRARA